MNQKFTSPLFWVAIVGAIKIVLDTVGIQIIDNSKVDALSNGLAAAAVLVGVVVDHGVITTKPVSMQDILDAITKLVLDIQPIVTAPTIAPVAPVVVPVDIPIATPVEAPVMVSEPVANAISQ